MYKYPLETVTPAYTVAASGTLTLTSWSSRVQIFTGSTNHTVLLPSTGVGAGDRWTIVNQTTSGTISVQSSAGNTVATLTANRAAILVAVGDSPTAATGWSSNNPSASPTALTIAQRDVNNVLFAGAFAALPSSTVTAAGVTTLAITSAAVQVFTGTTTQTVKLPSTSVVAGQVYTIINTSTGSVAVQSSGANAIVTIGANRMGFFIPAVATPTAATDWFAIAPNQSPLALTVALRDVNNSLFASTFIALPTSTATAAGTTTLSITSTQTQIFTGSTTQTVKLPTTSVQAGQQYTIVNQSSGVVTVQSSDATTISTVAAGSLNLYVAQQSTPTTGTHWRSI